MGTTRLSAREAHAMGLVNRVVPRADLEAEALRTARTIAVMDGGAVRLTKEAINRAADIMGLPQALEAGIDLAVQVETLDTRRSAASSTRSAGATGSRPRWPGGMRASPGRARQVDLKAPGNVRLRIFRIRPTSMPTPAGKRRILATARRGAWDQRA